MSAQIPQVQPWLTEAEREAVGRVLARNWITEGPESKAFSERLNAFIGASYGVFAPNGTLALALGLMALDIGPGDQVLVPDMTFIGSATAVLMVGATPVFVDVEPDNYQIDVGHAERLITERTRAIMPVHLYGSACDMDSVMALARRRGLRVIEDAAQGIGVGYCGRHVGSFGDIGCFSFFADKTLTTGEGGYVICQDSAIYDRLLHLRNQGRLDGGSYVHPEIGFNFRITDLQAAIGLAQLDRLPEIIARKAALHAEYGRQLAGIGDVRILGAGKSSTFVPFRCVLVAERAEELRRHLQQANIQPRTFFCPLHRQPCFAQAAQGRRVVASLEDAGYPQANYGYEHGLCLPIFPTLEIAQVDYIAACICEFYGKDRPASRGSEVVA
jgi:perosamine synthetase